MNNNNTNNLQHKRAQHSESRVDTRAGLLGETSVCLLWFCVCGLRRRKNWLCDGWVATTTAAESRDEKKLLQEDVVMMR